MQAEIQKNNTHRTPKQINVRYTKTDNESHDGVDLQVVDCCSTLFYTHSFNEQVIVIATDEKNLRRYD